MSRAGAAVGELHGHQSRHPRAQGGVAWLAGVGAAAVTIRDEGAVEIAQEQGGDLHVQGVGDGQQGLGKLGAGTGVLAVLQRGIHCQKEQAPWDAGAWGKLNCMKTAHGMEHPPGGA